MNKIQIIGRLTGNPELKTTSSGVQVCSFSVAVHRRFNREETDFFPVVVWREAGVNCNKYLSKGSQVAVVGSVQLNRYEDKDGIKRVSVSIQAEEVEYLSSPKNQNEDTSKTAKEIVDSLQEVDDENMPF